MKSSKQKSETTWRINSLPLYSLSRQILWYLFGNIVISNIPNISSTKLLSHSAIYSFYYVSPFSPFLLFCFLLSFLAFCSFLSFLFFISHMSSSFLSLSYLISPTYAIVVMKFSPSELFFSVVFSRLTPCLSFSLHISCVFYLDFFFFLSILISFSRLRCSSLSYHDFLLFFLIVFLSFFATIDFSTSRTLSFLEQTLKNADDHW